MAEQYDLYGAMSLSMKELCIKVEKVLSIKFDLHDSMYRGGDYYRAGLLGSNEEIAIQLNRFVLYDEEETAEPSYSEYPVILRIAWTQRGDEYRRKLNEIEGLDFLRRESR